MELWDCRKDEHDDGGKEEERADYDQHLGSDNCYETGRDISKDTFAADEEFGSSNSFQMTFLSFAQHIPSNGLI